MKTQKLTSPTCLTLLAIVLIALSALPAHGQNVPATAREAARLPQYAERLAHPGTPARHRARMLAGHNACSSLRQGGGGEFATGLLLLCQWSHRWPLRYPRLHRGRLGRQLRLHGDGFDSCQQRRERCYLRLLVIPGRHAHFARLLPRNAAIWFRHRPGHGFWCESDPAVHFQQSVWIRHRSRHRSRG